MMLAILLMGLLGLASATWTSPEMFMRSNFFLEYYDSYTDPTTGNVHVLANTDENITYYIRFSLNTMSKLMQLPSNVYSALACRITGEGDGNHIFISYHDSNFDVQFLESSDGGNVWTPQRKLNKKETCNLGSMVVNQESKRLYLIYSCTSSLIYISRAPGSIVFGEEKVIWDKTPIFSTTSVVTLRRKKPLLHVFFQTEKTVLYTQSFDTGVTWSAAEDIFVHADLHWIRAVANTMISNTLFLLYAAGDNTMAVVYSNDNAESFSDPVKTPGDMLSLNVAVCGSKEKPMLATVANEGNYTQWTGWETKSLVPKMFDTPFSNEHDRGLSCGVGATIKVTMVGNLPKTYNNALAVDQL